MPNMQTEPNIRADICDATRPAWSEQMLLTNFLVDTQPLWNQEYKH